MTNQRLSHTYLCIAFPTKSNITETVIANVAVNYPVLKLATIACPKFKAFGQLNIHSSVYLFEEVV